MENNNKQFNWNSEHVQAISSEKVSFRITVNDLSLLGGEFYTDNCLVEHFDKSAKEWKPLGFISNLELKANSEESTGRLILKTFAVTQSRLGINEAGAS